MTSAAPGDEHRPLSAGATALAPQPASRPSSARRPRADRAGAAPAEPAER
ncbi:hypothetical protein I7412_42455, partial [Frankia sp. CN6]|nr:hypothetical protein [Frankia nepalensis]